MSGIVLALLRLADPDGVIRGMPQQAIAAYAGVSRTTLSTKLYELGRQHLVQVERKQITLLDPARLRRLDFLGAEK